MKIEAYVIKRNMVLLRYNLNQRQIAGDSIGRQILLHWKVAWG